MLGFMNYYMHTNIAFFSVAFAAVVVLFALNLILSISLLVLIILLSLL
jgi:hypothetical protein